MKFIRINMIYKFRDIEKFKQIYMTLFCGKEAGKQFINAGAYIAGLIC